MRIALPNSLDAARIKSAFGLSANQAYCVSETTVRGVRLLSFARPRWGEARTMAIDAEDRPVQPDWRALGATVLGAALAQETELLERAEEPEAKELVGRIDAACRLPRAAGIALWAWIGGWRPAPDSREALRALDGAGWMFRSDDGLVLIGASAAFCASGPTLADVCLGLSVAAEE